MNNIWAHRVRWTRQARMKTEKSINYIMHIGVAVIISQLMEHMESIDKSVCVDWKYYGWDSWSYISYIFVIVHILHRYRKNTSHTFTNDTIDQLQILLKSVEKCKFEYLLRGLWLSAEAECSRRTNGSSIVLASYSHNSVVVRVR